MDSMFKNCYLLESLDLSSFDTQLNENMNEMFRDCSNLKSLDLKNFDTSKITNMDHLFDGCSSLEYLDLQNFNITSTTTVNDMFKDCREDLIYCLKNENKEQILTKLDNQLSPSNNNYSHICIEYKHSKFILEENRCIDNCVDDDAYQFEYNKICFAECQEWTRHSPDQPFLCENDFFLNCNIKCNTCNKESNDINLCITCNTNGQYFAKINDSTNINGFINCYNEVHGYYLDTNEKIYKNCFSNYKNCEEFNGENIK